MDRHRQSKAVAVIVLGTVASLDGCVRPQGTHVRTEGGHAIYQADCLNWHECTEQAKETCSENGYEVQEKSTGEQRSLLFRCRTLADVDDARLNQQQQAEQEQQMVGPTENMFEAEANVIGSHRQLSALGERQYPC